MKLSVSGFSELKFLSLTLFLLLASAGADAADDGCQSSGEWNFICGQLNAEDLVFVPASSWIISSGMAPGAAIYLIDSEQKTWSELYPVDLLFTIRRVRS